MCMFQMLMVYLISHFNAPWPALVVLTYVISGTINHAPWPALVVLTYVISGTI